MIGQRIKEIRHNNNLTQEELSKDIISRTYLSLIEKGTVQPSTNVLIKLSERLNCSVDDFLNEVSAFEHNDVEILKEISYQEYQLTQRNFDAVTDFIKKNVLSVQHLPQEERGRVHAIHGKFYYYQHDFKRAYEHLKEARAHLAVVPIHQNYVDTCIKLIKVESANKNNEKALDYLDDLYISMIKFDWNLVDVLRVYFYYVDVYFQSEQLFTAERYFKKYQALCKQLNIQYKQKEAKYLELKILFKKNALEALHDAASDDRSTVGQLFSAYYYYAQGNIRKAKELYDLLPSENDWIDGDKTYHEVNDLLKNRLLMI